MHIALLHTPLLYDVMSSDQPRYRLIHADWTPLEDFTNGKRVVASSAFLFLLILDSQPWGRSSAAAMSRPPMSIATLDARSLAPAASTPATAVP